MCVLKVKCLNLPFEPEFLNSQVYLKWWHVQYYLCEYHFFVDLSLTGVGPQFLAHCER